jgi:hypothetical protein
VGVSSSHFTQSRVATMDISTSFKNSKNIYSRMPLDPNFYHNQDVGLQLNGGNMAELQLLFIMTTKIDAC